jgi:hypothetical protein
VYDAERDLSPTPPPGLSERQARAARAAAVSAAEAQVMQQQAPGARLHPWVEAGPCTFHAQPRERQRAAGDRFKKLTKAEEVAMANKAARALESAKDEVQRQAELAVECTNKVRGLERDRQNMVHSFNSRLAVLNGNISECERAQLDADRLLQVRDRVALLYVRLIRRASHIFRPISYTTTGLDESLCVELLGGSLATSHNKLVPMPCATRRLRYTVRVTNPPTNCERTQAGRVNNGWETSTFRPILPRNSIGKQCRRFRRAPTAAGLYIEEKFGWALASRVRSPLCHGLAKWTHKVMGRVVAYELS